MIKYSAPFRIVSYSPPVETLQGYRPLLATSPSLVKTAKVIKIVPKENDFLYVRARAVSAGNVIEAKDGTTEIIPIDSLLGNLKRYARVFRGANDNGDLFSYEELVQHYRTFIGKSAFVDHDNENVERARGIILDAVWNDRGKYAELLMAVDQVAYPELARGISAGYITDVSMGCRCGHSICSICGNKAVMEDDFCEHVRNFKASTFQGLPVFEDNRDIEFFECSFVTTGADKTAKIIERVATRQAHVMPAPTVNVAEGALVRVAQELNQRERNVVNHSLKQGLHDLPWS